MVKPFFSIVIPTLNEEKYLPLLLNDLKHQTDGDYEVLVVDAQSEDDTVNQARVFAKVQLLASPRRHVATQRNLGLEIATGSYVLFMDADTRLPAYFLQGIKYRLSSDPADIFTALITHDPNHPSEKPIAFLCNLYMELGYNTKAYRAYGAFMGIHSQLAQKGLRFNSELPFCEDDDFVKQAVKWGYRFQIYQDPKYVYSLRRFKSSGNLNLVKKVAKLHLQHYLTGKFSSAATDYPMLGGKAYETTLQTSPLQLQQFLNQLNQIKKWSKKINYADFLKQIFT